MKRFVRDPKGDSGAVAIIVTICLILLFILVSLAIDLGFARADVRNNQTMSDFASLAAVDAIRDGGGYVAACEAAVDYVFANADELVYGSSDHDTAKAQCSGFLSGGCDPTISESTPAISAGPYTIVVTAPVLNNDPTMTVEGQAVNPEVDGEPCDRVKVSVSRQRDYIFGPVAGNLAGNPGADAVAVYFEEELPPDIASLIVLEQKDCDALTTSGTGAFFRVNDGLHDGETFPGLIATDSDGTSSPRGSGTNCNTGSRTVINHGTGTICAQGNIGSYALAGPAADKSHPAGSGTADCVLPPNGGGLNGLGVEVIERPVRLGRKAVDWLVNCQVTYPAYSTSGGNQRYPFYGDTPACPMTYGPAETPLPPFLDNLRAQVHSGSLAGAGFTPVGGNGNCSGNLTAPAGVTKIHVTCTPGSQTNSIIFDNVTHVVFNSGVPQQVPTLRITGPTPDPATGNTPGAIVYFRDDGLRRNTTGTTTTLTNVFVYVDIGTEPAGNDYGVQTNGGNVNWSGVTRGFVDGKPVLHDDCEPLVALPTAACFAPLALWSNSNGDHTFGGNGSQTIGGSYFMPNADVFFHGGGTADFTKSQFFGRIMAAVGGGQVTLVPNPETNVQPPRINFGLIR